MATEIQIMREFAKQAAMLPDDDLRKALPIIQRNLRTARMCEEESAIWHLERKMAAYAYEASQRGGYLR